MFWVCVWLFLILCLLIDLSIKLLGIRAELKKANLYLAAMPYDEKKFSSSENP